MFLEAFHSFWYKGVILFCLSLLALCLGAAETTADGVELATTDREIMRELRDIDRQLCTLFRITSRRSPVRCRIAVSEQAPRGTLSFSAKNNSWTLEFNPDDGKWVRDFNLRKQLMAYLLAAKIGRDVPSDAEFLPDWVAAGIEARMAAARQAERLLRRNRYFPVLRIGCETGRQPDFQVLMKLRADTLPVAGRLWYDEFARLLLETAVTYSNPTDNALLDYLILRLNHKGTEPEIYASTLQRVFLGAAARIPAGRFRDGWEALSDSGKVQRLLEYSADRAACNEYFPRPAHWTSADFQRVRDLSYQLLDAEGKPAGEFLTLPLEQMPGFLISRADAAALKQRKIQELNELLPGSDPDFVRALRGVTEAIRALPEKRDEKMAAAEETFLKAIAGVEQTLQAIEKRENWLDMEALRLQTPFEIHRVELETVSVADPVLSEAAGKYIERVERIYLDE